MGDGSISYGNGTNPYIQCSSITSKYLEHLDDIFEVLSSSPFKSRTAEELANQNRNTGFDESASANTYSDQYYWKTVSHPEIEEFSSWYDSGSKVWPENITLSPTVLKHWYCGDGHYNEYNNGRIEISINNEIDNDNKIASYFDPLDINMSDSNFVKNNRSNGSTGYKIVFREEQSEVVWKYMGDPLPGFEYKWPERFK